ncbi:MAG: aminotransferase class I/II-fold pyridoxal phosphate-dependent enzyme [Pyrinomonadaceae bacterium]
MKESDDKTFDERGADGRRGDVPAEEFRAALHRAADWVADYRARIEGRRVSPDTEPGEVTALLPPSMPESPSPLSELFAELDRVVLPHVVNWGHPSFFGYFGSTTTAPGIVGEFIAAALNVSAMTWRTSPAATELETVVLAWMRGALGLPEEFTGVVYDTASVALLHALAAAREGLGLEVRRRGLAARADVPTLRVYASEQAHSSIEKAAIMLGLGEENVRRVATDERFRMDARALGRAIEEDARAGALPLAVVATTGTTSAAACDPVEEVAALCREHGVWLHVDAAYGGALAMLAEYGHVARALAAADSVVVNPHKWLFVPLDFSALYTRRPELLRQTFSLVPEYLRGDAERGEVNYMDYGVQLGRRFRALKAWAVFKTFGRAGLESRIREHLRLARHFARGIDGLEGFELAAPQEMAVVCFRALPPHDSDAPADELNRALVEAVNATGRAYLTHTTLRGRVAARVAVGNVLTEERHLDALLALLREEAARLTARQPFSV